MPEGIYLPLGIIVRINEIIWKRKWQPTPVFLPGESHGQRSLAGYRPHGHKELNMTEHTHKGDNRCVGVLRLS